MAVDDDRGEAGIQLIDAGGRSSGVRPSASASMIADRQPFPRQNVAIRPAQTGFSTAASVRAERLVDLRAAAGVDQDEVEL